MSPYRKLISNLTFIRRDTFQVSKFVCLWTFFVSVFLSNGIYILIVDKFMKEKRFLKRIPFVAMLEKSLCKLLVNCVWSFSHKTFAFWGCHS